MEKEIVVREEKCFNKIHIDRLRNGEEIYVKYSANRWISETVND